METKLPEEVARLREDMLRAMGSVVNRTDENVKSALSPIEAQLKPITALIGRSHTLLKWIGATVVTLLIGTATAVVIAFVLQILTLK